jgi:hypothetical protein
MDARKRACAGFFSLYAALSIIDRRLHNTFKAERNDIP